MIIIYNLSLKMTETVVYKMKSDRIFHIRIENFDRYDMRDLCVEKNYIGITYIYRYR